MLRSDICDYSDAYIVVTGEITVVKRVFTTADFVAPNYTQGIVTATNTANTNGLIDGKLAFKNNLFLKRTIYFMRFKNQSCIDWKRGRFRCCNAYVQFD